MTAYTDVRQRMVSATLSSRNHLYINVTRNNNSFSPSDPGQLFASDQLLTTAVTSRDDISVWSVDTNRRHECDSDSTSML